MAKVKTAKIHFDGASFLQEFHCNADGEFSSALPPQVVRVLGINKVTGKTLDEVDTKWDEAVAKYRAVQTSTRKVIFYDVEIQGRIWGGDKLLLDRKDMHFSAGLGIAIKASIYLEHKRTQAGGSASYSYEEVEGDENSLPDSIRPRSAHGGGGAPDDRSHHKEIPAGIIEWSAAREKFFVDVCLGMERMILTVADAFKDDKAVIKLADSGRNLLPAPSTK